MKSTVTYSPEDNKIRLYVGRVPKPDYERLRAAGFISTPKQDCDFVATWTPTRENLAAEYLEDGEDIGDEDYSPEERAADRAERFEGYREKRTDEATGRADAFDAGPSAFGHQNAARAERQAKRHDRHRTRAVSQWAKAEYWQTRTAGVIAHALHKSSASVRRGRILTLEAELRKHEKHWEESERRYRSWSAVTGMEGAAVVHVTDGETKPPMAWRAAYALAGSGSCWGDYQHPRNPERKTSLYSLLTAAADPLTPAECAALYLADHTDPAERLDPWGDHYRLRLEYERAMLAAEGGSAADVEMIPGGFIRKTIRHGDGIAREYQIHKVNRSPVTKRVTSVDVWDENRKTYKLGERIHSPGLTQLNIERAGEDAYRAPTQEELAEFNTKRKAEKATKKTVSTINPKPEDAQALQSLWNATATANAKNGKSYADVTPDTMTQAEFSRKLKYEYVEIKEFTIGETTFKARVKRSGGYCDYSAPMQLIVLSDKPQKALTFGIEVVV